MGSARRLVCLALALASASPLLAAHLAVQPLLTVPVADTKAWAQTGPGVSTVVSWPLGAGFETALTGEWALWPARAVEPVLTLRGLGGLAWRVEAGSFEIGLRASGGPWGATFEDLAQGAWGGAFQAASWAGVTLGPQLTFKFGANLTWLFGLGQTADVFCGFEVKAP